jgi:CHAT domain-containing protein
VRGLSPLMLCGLALSGANAPEDDRARAGVLTAAELATVDLVGCSLAVLSACDTALGENRAGQGVASLQSALHAAGARTAVTSLWKVPDAATRELMAEFYRRLLVEGDPPRRALWRAKRVLRDARDAAGRPRFGVRDWAGWVVTGD